MGIGATLAKRFAEAGATIPIHGFPDFDLTIGNHLSSIPKSAEILAKQFKALGLNVTAVTPSDLEIKGNAEKFVEEAAERLGGLDGMILNHAYGVYAEIGS